MVKETVKQIAIWLFIFVVGSLIVSVIVSPEIAVDLKNRVVDTFSSIKLYESKDAENSQDSLIDSCNLDYEKYSNAYKIKYDHLRLNKVESQKMDSSSEAEEFYNLYGGPSFDYGLAEIINSDWDGSYPIVLIFAKISASEGSIPLILLCKPDGKLSDTSKKFIA